MCLVVMVGTNCPLPTAPFDPNHRAIAVQDLGLYPDLIYPTRLLAKPYRYDIGYRYGCGCGFRYSPQEPAQLGDEDATDSEIENVRSTLEDLQRLADLVAIGVQAGPVEIFTCWESDLSTAAIETQRTVTLDSFRQLGLNWWSASC